MMFDPHLAPAALQQCLRERPNDPLVVCYCALWCDTCQQYRQQFEALSTQWPNHVFIWADIEENPEWLGDEDVENFPTILVQEADGGNLFFGTQLPHIGHLERLLSHLQQAAPGQTQVGPPPLRDLAGV